MGVFRSIGKGVGTAGGGLIGGTVKIAGKAVGRKWKGTGEWLQEVGDGVQNASKIALENAGQFIDGASKGTYGVLKKDDYYKQEGLKDLKDSTGRTVKGIGSAITYTVSNAGSTINGFKNGNKEQALHGLKNLGKVVAVSSLAIGIADLVAGTDFAGAEEIDTINDHLEGYEHPDTGVLFVEKTVEVPNEGTVNGIFPIFDSQFSVVISEDLYFESDSVQFGIANDTLYQAIQGNPDLAHEMGLSQTDIQALANGQTPEGYTWHHNEEPGVLQLVDEEIHNQTGHTGGRSIWGGGSEFR